MQKVIISEKDKMRLEELSNILFQIKDEHMKDQLLGAAKWAAAENAVYSKTISQEKPA